MRPHFTRFSAWFIHLTVLFVSASQILAQQGSRYAGYGVQQANNGQAFPWTSNFVQRAKPSKREAAHHACTKGLYPTLHEHISTLQHRTIFHASAPNHFAPSAPSVYIAISSLAATDLEGNITDRQIELYWHNGKVQRGDWVGLFDYDPSGLPLLPLERFHTIDYPQGWVLTSTRFNQPGPTVLNFSKRCLGYWIGYVRGNRTISVNCIKSQPTWMVEMKDVIGDWTMRDLCLPGAHGAAEYWAYEGASSDQLLSKYLVNQEEDIFRQLLYGIRYLDIRVGFYPLTQERFWTNHGVWKFRPLLDAIPQVRTFLENTNEIVIFDFHEFTNFPNTSIHDELMQLMYKYLGDYMAPKKFTWNATLSTLWNTGRRLIVGYNDAGSGNAYAWDGVVHQWGNINDPAKLHPYLESVMLAVRNEVESPLPWSAQAELTPSASDILTDRFGGLRVMADMVNRNVTRWFRDGQWWRISNVVCVDFFLGSDIVDVALKANRRRAKCKELFKSAKVSTVSNSSSATFTSKTVPLPVVPQTLQTHYLLRPYSRPYAFGAYRKRPVWYGPRSLL